MAMTGKISSNQNRQPWNTGMWVMVIAVIVVIGAAIFGWFGRWGRGMPADAVKAGEVAANGIAYYGKPIKIYGYVSNPVAGRLFEISDAISGTAPLLVVVKGPEIAVTTGQGVIVEGVPTAFDADRIKQDYSVEFPEEPTRGWKDRPAVIAANVRVIR